MSDYEQQARRLALASYFFGAAALIGIIKHKSNQVGFGFSAFSVFRMMRANHAGDPIKCVFWQRVRVISNALSISLLTLPLVIPHFSPSSSILLRTTNKVGSNQ